MPDSDSPLTEARDEATAALDEERAIADHDIEMWATKYADLREVVDRITGFIERYHAGEVGHTTAEGIVTVIWLALEVERQS